MAVKYHCKKCGKRYIDWGAEKLGFKCPDCDGEELVRIGAGDERAAKRPSLKRRARKAAPVVAIEEDFYSGDVEEGIEEVVEDEELVIAGATDDVETEAEYALDSPVPADLDDVEEGDLEITEDLAFDTTPPLTEETLTEDTLPEPEEWPE